MPTIRTLSLVTLTIAASALLTGCGEDRPDAGGLDSVLPTRTVEVPKDVDQIRQDVDAFYQSWHGSLDDRQAADVVLAYELNGKFDECVEEAGFEQDWRDTINTAAEWPALQPTRWLREPMRLWSAPKLLQYREFGTDEDTDVTDPKHSEAIRRCRKENPPLSRPNDLLFPKPLDKLEAEWKQLTTGTVWPITGDEDAYVACLSKNAEVVPGEHLDSSSYDDMINSYLRLLASIEPTPAEIPDGQHEPSEKWNAYVAAETAFEEAAWECSEPVYNAGMRALPDLVNTFQSKHATDIQELERHWDEMRTTAEGLGWSPDEPYAGR